jgi:hypothetical protein
VAKDQATCPNKQGPLLTNPLSRCKMTAFRVVVVSTECLQWVNNGCRVLDGLFKAVFVVNSNAACHYGATETSELLPKLHSRRRILALRVVVDFTVGLQWVGNGRTTLDEACNIDFVSIDQAVCHYGVTEVGLLLAKQLSRRKMTALRVFVYSTAGLQWVVNR